MKFEQCLKLIVVYYVFALLFNMISLLRMQFDLAPLINGNPGLSIILLSLFIVLYLFGKYSWHKSFICLAVLGLIALPIRGITPHITAIIDQSYSLYLAEYIAWIAALINIFGVLVIVLCAINSPFLNLRKLHAIK